MDPFRTCCILSALAIATAASSSPPRVKLSPVAQLWSEWDSSELQVPVNQPTTIPTFDSNDVFAIRAFQLASDEPFVIRNVSALNRVAEKWTPSYVSEVFPIDQRSGKYIIANSSSHKFLANDLASLYDTRLSGLLVRNPMGENVLDCRAGFKGAWVATHYDTCDAYIGLVSGQRRVLLIPPTECSKLRPAQRRADIDLFSPEHISKDIVGLDVVVEAGDLLFIPAYWFHSLLSLTETMQCLASNLGDKTPDVRRDFCVRTDGSVCSQGTTSWTGTHPPTSSPTESPTSSPTSRPKSNVKKVGGTVAKQDKKPVSAGKVKELGPKGTEKAANAAAPGKKLGMGLGLGVGLAAAGGAAVFALRRRQVRPPMRIQSPKEGLTTTMTI